ncbi:hypothetical protein FRC10_009568 [Ceratobasidium sp. 414]|nr:hypothetical protein FRC10_009568 [Ceratobasidium sp. 414]
MEGSSVPQPATPDGHSHQPPQYDPNVASTSSTGAQQQATSDPDNSMEWQDVSFISNEVVPPDEDDAAYKRRKARERQRRKRMKDRENGIGRNGQPATPRRYPGIEVAQFAGGASPWADPPPDPVALAAMSPEEARKEKMRRAARERQRKHRAVVRARKADEENTEDLQASSSTSGAVSAPVADGALPPPSVSEPVDEGHAEPDISHEDSPAVSYDQQQQAPFAYYPHPMWAGNPFGPGQFFHPHGPHPGPFVQGGQLMPPPGHLVQMMPQPQAPPQTMNPMQMQVSPAPPSSPQPPKTPTAPAPALTPSPAPTSTPAPAPSPVSAPPPVPAASALAPAPAPPPPPISAPPAPPAHAIPVLAPAPLALPMPAPTPVMPPPPPNHTAGHTFAMILTLALNSSNSMLLRAHIMQQLRLTPIDLVELEGVIARAFDVWDRERGGGEQVQPNVVPPGALAPMFPQPLPPPAASHTHPLTQQPQHLPPTPHHPTTSTPVTPQSQPRPRASTTSTTRRALGVGHPPPPPSSSGTLNVPRQIAGRSVTAGGLTHGVHAPGQGQGQSQGSAQAQNQRSISQPQRHAGHAVQLPRSTSSAVAPPSSSAPVAGQKRPAPGSQPSSQSQPQQPQSPNQSQPQSQPGQTQRSTHPLHQQQTMRSPAPQSQGRVRAPSQHSSRPTSQPQTPGGNGAPNGDARGNGAGGSGSVAPANTVLGQLA